MIEALITEYYLGGHYMRSLNHPIIMGKRGRAREMEGGEGKNWGEGGSWGKKEEGYRGTGREVTDYHVEDTR